MFNSFKTYPLNADPLNTQSKNTDPKSTESKNTNQARRSILKLLSASTASIAAGFTGSLLASTSTPYFYGSGKIANQLSDSRGEITNIVFDVNAKGIFGRPAVVISNRSESVATLTHIYPGIVHAEGKTFDLNDLLTSRKLTLAAGESLKLPLPVSHPERREQPVPKGLTRSQAFTVKTRLKNSNTNKEVRTLRSVFS